MGEVALIERPVGRADHVYSRSCRIYSEHPGTVPVALFWRADQTAGVLLSYLTGSINVLDVREPHRLAERGW